MISIEIRGDDGLTIIGSQQDLCALASHILRAAARGEASATFVPDAGMTTVDVICTDHHPLEP